MLALQRVLVLALQQAPVLALQPVLVRDLWQVPSMERYLGEWHYWMERLATKGR